MAYDKKFSELNSHNIYIIPAGEYFKKQEDACFLVYSPLANVFFLSLPSEVENMEQQLKTGETNNTLNRLLNCSFPKKVNDLDTFCTLHLLLNEKCNFRCKYCYSAVGRSSAELSMDDIDVTLNYFLSSQRKAPAMRSVVFMGGGEPTLSWNILEQSTVLAEQIAAKNGIKVDFSLITNGSILNDQMLDFMKTHKFTVQVSFEVLPDIQNAQRGMNDTVAANVLKLSEANISNYVRSTITDANVDLLAEMVRYCQANFPDLKKLSCQYVIDAEYFTSEAIVQDYFNRYSRSFVEATKQAKKTDLELRFSSSHLMNYSQREKFCCDIICLTPYGSFTTCPDVSSPKEGDYEQAIFGKIENSEIIFDQEAFARLTSGSIHSIEQCQTCWARWNCGSGCPNCRRVLSAETIDGICDFYRRMLRQDLMSELAFKYEKATGKDFYQDIATKLENS